MSTIHSSIMVESMLFASDAYTVFSGRQSDGSLVRVRANKTFDVQVGECYEVLGELTTYRDSWGKSWSQINSISCDRTRLSGALVGRWLERLPNVGEARAGRLLNHYRDGLGTILSDGSNVSEVAKILEPSKPVLANRISSQIFAAVSAKNASETTALDELAFLTKLESVGVTDDRAARSLWRLVGGRGAIERLLRNPYLAASIVDWKVADSVGQKLLVNSAADTGLQAHPARLLGAIDSVWRDMLSKGDTASTPLAFADALVRKAVPVEAAIAIGLEKGAIRDSGTLYRAPGAAWLEDTLSAKLKGLELGPPGIDVSQSSDIKRYVECAQRHTGLTLHDEQVSAVEALLDLPVAVLQGGAGVGKTTVMKVLVTAWESLGGNVVMGALAGKAALQLSRGTSTALQPRIAYTVARLIRMLDDKSHEGLTFNSKTLLILDESSMLDTPSLRLLLSFLPQGARVLFVGDEGQLPPVGIGRVFHDLVADGTRLVTLQTVHRQGTGSPIPGAASLIRQGTLPHLVRWDGYSSGIFRMEDSSKLLALYGHIRSLTEDVMVVAARRKTVDDFNRSASQQYRMALNGDTKAFRLGPLASVAKGDYVVCTRNRYKDGLFNGLRGCK